MADSHLPLFDSVPDTAASKEALQYLTLIVLFEASPEASSTIVQPSTVPFHSFFLTGKQPEQCPRIHPQHPIRASVPLLASPPASAGRLCNTAGSLCNGCTASYKKGLEQSNRRQRASRRLLKQEVIAAWLLPKGAQFGTTAKATPKRVASTSTRSSDALDAFGCKWLQPVLARSIPPD